MIRSCASYTDDQLWQLLQGDDQDHTESANHLAECPHCQARLEQLAADAEQWSEIRDSLQPDQEFDTGSSPPLKDTPSRKPRSDRERWQRSHHGPSRWLSRCCHRQPP